MVELKFKKKYFNSRVAIVAKILLKPFNVKYYAKFDFKAKYKTIYWLANTFYLKVVYCTYL